MATGTAIVIPPGLTLTPDFMAERNPTPGTSVIVTGVEAPRNLHASLALGQDHPSSVLIATRCHSKLAMRLIPDDFIPVNA